jgi:hypothetical protein
MACNMSATLLVLLIVSVLFVPRKCTDDDLALHGLTYRLYSRRLQFIFGLIKSVALRMLYAGAQADSSEFLTPVARRIGPVPPLPAANTGILGPQIFGCVLY